MTPEHEAGRAGVDETAAIADAAAARALSWLVLLGVNLDEPGLPAAPQQRSSVPHDLLEGVRDDSESLGFARRLLEAVMGTSDAFAVALNLRDMSRDLPSSMPVVERLAVRAGGVASLGLPWAVLPVARKWLRERVSHLVLTAKLNEIADGVISTVEVRDALRDRAATHAATSQTAPQAATHMAPPVATHAADVPAATHTTVALGGLRLLGKTGAETELQRLIALAKLEEVTHLSVDVNRLAPQGMNGAWALDSDSQAGAARLRRLFEVAQAHHTAVTLESSDYRSALLAPQLLIQALSGTDSDTDLSQVCAGVSLPAELPESLQAAQALMQFSRVRVKRGAIPLEVVIGVAGLTAREQIHSILSGHPVTTLDTAAEQSAQLLRVLKALLDAGDSVRAVVASEDVHLLAAVTVLAQAAGQHITLQLRAGVATELEAAVREHGFAVRHRLPLIPSKEFSAAATYLIALAAETSQTESVLVRTRALLAGEPGQFAAGTLRLREALQQAAQPAPESHRVQHREVEWSDDARDTVAYYRAPTDMHRIDTGGLTAAVLGLTRAHSGAITMEVLGEMLRVPTISATGFANEPDTDPSKFDNRTWARTLLARAKRSDIGVAGAQQASEQAEDYGELLERALVAGAPWRELRANERGNAVARLALGLAAAREQLFEVLAAESGAPTSVIDAEVSGAIDAARYMGQLGAGLGAVRGARFDADRMILVVADAGVPLHERAEAVCAALATGAAVTLVAHQSVARSSSVLLDELRASGVPDGVVNLVVGVDHVALATLIAADVRVDRAMVIGQRDTARDMLRRRPDLRIEGRFRVPGVTVISQSADPQLAVRHALISAFGAHHASADTARILVLLGGAARSQAIRRALIDAVESMAIGHSARPGSDDALAFELGPLPEAPSKAGLRALAQLDAGEEWLVKPQRLDAEGLLWRPGIRMGLSRNARFWSDAVGVPVIGLLTAHSIDEAISLTNRLGGGGVAALEANDPGETLPWLERARAASLSLGRPTTHVRVERQPVGGWGEAAMGAGLLAGGPNRLLTLGSWSAHEGTASSTLHLRGLRPEVRVLIEVAQASLDYPSFDRVRRAALSDTLAWRTGLGKAEDVSGLGVERNLLRHRPVSSHVRLAEAAPIAELIRVVCAGLVAGAPMTVSTGVVLPPEVGEFLAMQGITVSLERDDAWLERMSVSGPGDAESPASRVRLIGGDRVRAAEWLGGLGDVALFAQPVTMAGPVELLAFVREQSVSICAHRHDLAMLPAGVGGYIAELQGRDPR